MAKTQTEETLLKQLKNPFDERFVKWRVGATNKDKTKGIALAYLDAREVTKRLDDVCGVGGWQDRLIELKDGFICELSIQMPGGVWVTKSDASDYTDVEAVKGGASSALKRAAAVWGVGRYLYYLPNVWVPIKSAGKSYVLAETPTLPDWAKPNANIERWEDVAELSISVTDEIAAEYAQHQLDSKKGIQENISKSLDKARQYANSQDQSDRTAGDMAGTPPRQDNRQKVEAGQTA